MRLVVTLEHRFARTPDGAIWTQAAFAYPFWSVYLETFPEISVVARVDEVAEPASDGRRADGRAVTFAALPHYLGPLQYARRARAVRAAVRGALREPAALILRVPSQIAQLARAAARARGRPYAVEVVGDPRSVFARGAVRHPLRRFFRWYFERSLRQLCAGAAAAAYVTERSLQQRYPARASAFRTHFSDVELPDAAFADAPKVPRERGPFTLLTVGSLAQLYKGTDVLLDAAADCIGRGVELRLVVVGEGRYRGELEGRAVRLGIAERVTFAGQLTAGEAVRRQLDGADLFVLPSRTEGLPRALLEAMARGLPCLASAVGGIPELLPASDLVPAGEREALATELLAVLGQPERRAHMAARNLEGARRYHERLLRPRRRAFYRAVADRTRMALAGAPR